MESSDPALRDQRSFELDRSQLAAALASLTSVPLDAVDVADADDSDNRNWDAAVSCTYNRVEGDVTWLLDLYLTEAVSAQPTEPQVAAHLAEQLGTAVLYPAAVALPSAYWLTAPGGLRTRARLYSFDEDDDRTVYRIDAVEQPVPSLPTVPVALQPEVIREYQVPTPITDGLCAWLTQWQATAAAEAEEAVWYARTRLGAWESLTVRMACGWPPDGWYPAEFYQEDLEIRDELAVAVELLPVAVKERFAIALTRLDKDFSAATGEHDDAQLSAMFGVGKVDLALRSWWWRRLPKSALWRPTAQYS